MCLQSLERRNSLIPVPSLCISLSSQKPSVLPVYLNRVVIPQSVCTSAVPKVFANSTVSVFWGSSSFCTSSGAGKTSVEPCH